MIHPLHSTNLKDKPSPRASQLTLTEEHELPFKETIETSRLPKNERRNASTLTRMTIHRDNDRIVKFVGRK